MWISIWEGEDGRGGDDRVSVNCRQLYGVIHDYCRHRGFSVQAALTQGTVHRYYYYANDYIDPFIHLMGAVFRIFGPQTR